MAHQLKGWKVESQSFENTHDEGEFENTKGVIRICKSKDRQHNGKKRRHKDKQRSTTTQNTKD